MHSRRKQPFGQRVAGNLRTKWAQVLLSMIALTLVIGATYKLTTKKKPVTDAEKKKQEAEYSFMHCDSCFQEMTYNADMAGKRSLGCKCKPGDAGYWEPTKYSMKNGSVSVYRLFYIFAVLETLIWLGLLVYMLGREAKAPDYYIHKCLHCGQMLRFRASAFDVLLECPHCEQWVRLPDAHEAKCQETHHEETAEKAIGVFEQRLRMSGHVFPGEELVADPDPNPNGGPGSGVQSQPPSRRHPPVA